MVDVNPPEIQRVIVKHLIKNEGTSYMHAPFRLRVFSGKIPRPSTEVDYDAWRGRVKLIFQDPSLSDLHRSRTILDSLLPPASEFVRHLGATDLPNAYLDILDSAFDVFENGDDLFARFLNTTKCWRKALCVSIVLASSSFKSDKNRCLLRQISSS